MKKQNILLALLVATAGLAAPGAQAGLIALYQYDNAGNLGLDSSGKGNNLQTSAAGATSGNGKYGTGLELANNNSGMLFSSNGTLAGLPVGSSSYTIASWINPDTAGNDNPGGIIGWGNYGNFDQVNALRMNGASGLHHYWWGDDLSAAAGADLTSGGGSQGWHFVAATYDATTKVNNIYIDNILKATRTVSTGPNVVAANFAIGRTFASEFFDGQLDNTAIFNHALTTTELTTIAGNNYSAYGVNDAPINVPEPASLALFGAGLVGLGALRRKRAGQRRG